MIIAIIGVLAVVGFWGYNKYQAVELEKNNLQAQLNEQNSDSQDNDYSEDDDQTAYQNLDYYPEEQVQDVDYEASEQDRDVKISRDNVFDYVIAAINDDGGNADLMNFQEPRYENGVWVIDANNKSGVGSYIIKAYEDGVVEIYSGIGDLIMTKEF
ncbi:hypothetical protein [Staphylococcus sp. 11262D007BW]